MSSLRSQEKELSSLYKKWPLVKRHLKKHGCSGAQAEDIIQEALLVYVHKMENSEFMLTHAGFVSAKHKPESRDGDIGTHRLNYYFVPSCRFENPAAH